jgi:hypothetical protein
MNIGGIGFKLSPTPRRRCSPLAPATAARRPRRRRRACPPPRATPLANVFFVMFLILGKLGYLGLVNVH